MFTKKISRHTTVLGLAEHGWSLLRQTLINVTKKVSRSSFVPMEESISNLLINKKNLAREFLLIATEKEDSPIDALRSVISRVDKQKFAKKTGSSVDDVSDFLSRRSDPTEDQVDRYLRHFGCKLTSNKVVHR